MKPSKTAPRILVVSFFFFLALFVCPRGTFAHCDAIDGPVVNAARKALETKNVNYVLIWVKPENEDDIRKALKRAKNKKRRANTKEEEGKAETEFFGTLVKVHREGEGADYEGIKPAGAVEPEIVLADKAVETGELNEALGHIPSESAKEVVRRFFQAVRKRAGYAVDDIPAGRDYVRAYAEFIHAAEKAIKGLH